MTDLRTRAKLLHDLHFADQPLVLPNCWDAASARAIQAGGAPVVATTSAGVAWSLGQPDGDALDRRTAVDAIARIVGAVDVPVSADIETGYGDTQDEVAETITAVLDAGAVGVNLEDAGTTTVLRPTAQQAERVAAARRAADSAGVDFYLNARVDTYLRAAGEPESRLDETIARAQAYLDAGASGIFVPGTTDEDTIKTLADAVSAPLNVMAGPGGPSTADLRSWGAARISVGPAIAEAAYALAQRAAAEVLMAGTYDSIGDGLDYMTVNSWLS